MNIFGFAIKKSILFPLIIVIILLLETALFLFYGGGFSGIVSYFHKNSSLANTIILFESNNCLHCKKVDDFIRNNEVADKVKFIRLEVFDNIENVNILEDKVQICGLDDQHIGVPFLWDGENKKCVVGYVDVIKFFQEKTGQKL